MVGCTVLLAGSPACSDATGSLTIVLEAEETITGGIAAGTGDEEILDGWSVSFDTYAVAVGDVDLHFATDDHEEAEAPETFVYDLASSPVTGEALWTIEALKVGRWELSYTQVHAEEAMRHEGVSTADYDLMAANECTYLIRGALDRADGRTCPPRTEDVPSSATADADGCYPNPSIAFELCADAETSFGPCSAEDGPSGVAVVEGGATVALTLHGDHIFFNGFPEGEEGGVMRFAQWLADCDLDLDGTVTRAELESIAIDDLAEIDDRYSLGGAPPLPNGEALDDVWAYVRSQLKTQGHMNGEGECPVDGVEHDHAHE